MMEIKISVRNLVEFILRSGSIDNRHAQATADNAMQEGSRIHRMIQKRMGDEYKSEVFMHYEYDTEKYQLIVEGRADGVITEDTGTTIDEIKTTYRDVSLMKEPYGVHVAQAKVYAAIYGIQNELGRIKVRMTYCNVETEELKYFEEEYTIDELKQWFDNLLLQYRKWADYECEWKQIRQASIEKLTFPFPYRDGQKELASYVYQTIYHKKKLFIEAPTGVGKTLSTVFPAIKAMGNGMGDKLFYFTAKTITRTVADSTFSLLREQGLNFKSIILTAKEKICFMEETECNPDYCPYANGHYDRINNAVYDLIRHSHNFNREIIEEYARKHHVCPFEFCLDMSLFADAVIGDYNYVFDPHVYLKRFFGDSVQGDYIFLVDEAHNLLERGRDMYSAVLVKEDFLKLKRNIAEADGEGNIAGLKDTPSSRLKEYGPKIIRQLEKCNRELLLLKRECEDCMIWETIESFIQVLIRLQDSMDKYLEENDDNPVRNDILDFYFEVSHFLAINERVDDNYVMYSETGSDGSFLVKLFCVNPSVNLQECMARGRSTILFSATLLPIQYYKKLLGGTKEDYEVYANSVFNPEKRALYISSDVTSKYTRRSLEEFQNIAGYIHEIIQNRHGNYMVFFPSHSFLSSVYECYCDLYLDAQTECIIQDEYMNEEAREAFLNRFTKNEDIDTMLAEKISMDIETEEDTQERNLIGFCVMGGIFGEGIDLKHDSLIGVIVVGTGIPQVCNEREILKQYFDAGGESGFDYAYRYPGMNKVLQAAGRVIRTSDDIGVIALLDERFLQNTYQRLFPREWENFEVVTQNTIAKRVEYFWNSWLT
ncbi:MAG TPA: ATP-dependent DNA helicase [Lachnospiraceae bacterium]|nr:ATP-dependent DNA helicase [Lachnospiraceae bacterium]